MDYTLYVMAAFWVCFIDLNVAWSADARFAARFPRYPGLLRPPHRASAWPVFLLGCNLGLLILSASLLKALDPQWRSGYGLYFTFLLPWIKAPWLSDLLQYRLAFKVVNYLVIALELAVLPLFLWRRSRKISIALTAAFFLGLIFPFRIDPIGYFGVADCVCLMALTGGLFGRPVRAIELQARPRREPLVTAAVVGAASFFMLFVSVMQHFREFRGQSTGTGVGSLYVRWPLKLSKRGARIESKTLNPLVDSVGSGQASFPPSSPSLSHRLFGLVEQTAARINWHSTRLQVNHVFGTADSRGNYLYRVVLTMNDGSTAEPFAAFRPDMRPGPYSSGVMVPRFMQGSLYAVTYAVNSIAYLHRQPDSDAFNLMARMIQFSKSLLPAVDQSRVVTAQVLVRPILMPLEYAGNVEPWSGSDWIELYAERGGPASGVFQTNIAQYPLDLPFDGGWHVTIDP
jgi:hypothetical protein